MSELDDILRDLIAQHPVPGAGIGVARGGRVDTAYAGVADVDTMRAIDDRTLFQIGSVSKTYAVTAVLRLVTDGRVDLDGRVRDYVPELRLTDEDVADRVTVRNLLNHTAGWDGTLTSGEDDPDAPLRHFVDEILPTLEQVGPLGERAEYNNAAVALAGRLVEIVTDRPYEQAVRELLLDPLGLRDTWFTTDDVPTGRVTAGHLRDADGTYRVARPWRWPRAGNPEGGLVSTLTDQLGWARFHLGDGQLSDGTRLLDADLVAAMRAPTIGLVGNPMGDAIGLGWFLRDVAGEPTLSHAGSTNGQFSELRVVPGRDVGVIACANGGPAGTNLVRDAVEVVLAELLDLRVPPLRFRAHDPAVDGEVAGTYVNNLASIEVGVDGGVVRVRFVLNPDVAAGSGADAPVFSPAQVRFRADDPGAYVVGEGEFDGMTGAFVRRGSGEVDELAFGGRWYRRTFTGAEHNAIS